MKKIYFLAPLILIFFLLIRTLFFIVQAEEDCNLLCLETKIKDLSRQLELSQAATKPLEETLNKLEKDIKNIQNQIIVLENGIVNKETELENLNSEIAKGDKELIGKQDLLSSRVRSLYIKSQLFSPFVLLLSKIQSSALIRELSFRESVTQKDKDEIIKTALFLKDIENKKNQAEILKAELEDETTRLASAKANIDKQAQFFRKEVTGAKSFQSSLSKEISVLSVKQQQILTARISSLNLPTSLGGGPLVCTDDRNIDPGFRPAFAFFSYGIPHRVGMNQYGAKGRADAGQKTEDILRAYFPNTELKKDYNTGININVSGANESGQNFNLSWDIETYVKHIYEMPTSWNSEALKAQAIAARSYALAYTKNGANSICATQNCQVVKLEENSDAWKSAVDDTRGWVLVNNGEPISAWFASTAGGYTWGSGDVWCKDENGNDRTYIGYCPNKSWTGRSRDTNGDIGSFGDLTSKSYDNQSPCFYSAQGWRNDYGKSAWLKSEEVALIVNALMLSKSLGSAPDGIESWNSDKIKQELKNRGGNPFNSISGVSVSSVDFGIGKTNSITVSGDTGSQTFDGLEFKNLFNLVAPANISIVGPLYNIETK